MFSRFQLAAQPESFDHRRVHLQPRRHEFAAMIIYDLACPQQHRFEGWFDNLRDYEDQAAGGLLSCPVCGSDSVHRVPTASRINSLPSEVPADAAPGGPQVRELLRKVHDYVDRHFEDVGGRFAEEAIRIHQGEVEPRNIRGRASSEEVKALDEAGVDAVALPPRPLDEDKLN
jgi:hypothetical protein